VRVTHKVDYAVRAMTALARHEREAPGTPTKRELLADEESIPPAFLDDILRSLRNGGLAQSQRGADGGWKLARPAKEISVGAIIRAVEGPLAAVRGIRPHELVDDQVAEPFVSLWVATRVALRSVLDVVTLADLAAGKLPAKVAKLLEQPDAWSAR
jgi:Rrf2 family protein